MPARAEQGLDVHVSGAAAIDGPAASTVDQAPRSVEPDSAARRRARSRPAGRAALLAKRRRLALGLTALAFLTLLLAVAGVLGWIVQLPADVLLGTYLVHLRSQAKRAASMARQRRRATVGGRARRDVYDPIRRESATVSYAVPAPGYVLEDTAWWDEVVVADDGEEDRWVTGTGAGSRWDPVPVPRPTYQFKPPAHAAPPAAPHRGDRASAPPAPHESVPAQPAAEGDWEDDAILARRRAVND